MAHDNLALAVTPRVGVDTTKITNLDDVMTVRMGGVIRSNGDITGAIQPVIMPFVGQQIFPMVEYIDAEEESRSGISRLFQGVDPNSLNKTATGVNALMNAAQARVELIARGLAETLIKPMFQGIMQLLAEHQDEAQRLTIRLRNEYVPLDPRVWETEYDMTVNVGLGTGTKDQQMAHLSNIVALQGQMMASPAGQMFPPQVLYEKFYNVVSKLVETAGFKDPSQFFPDPKQAQQPPPPPPHPSVQTAQIKAQTDGQKQQSDMQMQAQKQQGQAALAQQELMMEAWLKKLEATMSAQLEKYKIDLQASVQREVGLANAMNRPQVIAQ
jgi:hypothetical protein